MSNIATNLEQSKHLLELGLDPKTADMFWMDTNSVKPCLKLIDDGIFNHRNYLVRFPNTSLPAWSLSALLEVMKEHCPELLFLEAYWYCRCMQAESEYCDDPITAAYDVLCWLLDHGAIKKELIVE